MQDQFRQLPTPMEVAIVVGLAFGYAILCSIYTLFSEPAGPPIGQGHLMSLLIYEGCITLILWYFLAARGWTLGAIGFVPDFHGAVEGCVIAASTYFLLWLLWIPIAALLPELHASTNSTQVVTKGLPISLVVAVSLLNPVYEELFVCGYLISAIEKMKSLTIAVNASVGIRMLYHLYQGPAGLSVIPMGLVFALFYAKTRRLWPLVIAHGLLDFFGLVSAT